MLEQKSGADERLVGMLIELLNDAVARNAMTAALARWHVPNAAEQIAARILQVIR